MILTTDGQRLCPVCSAGSGVHGVEAQRPAVQPHCELSDKAGNAQMSRLYMIIGTN